MKDDHKIYLALEDVQADKRINQCAAMHAMSAFFILIYALQYLYTWKEDWVYFFTLGSLSIYVLVKAFFRKKFFYDPQINRNFRILEMGFIFMGATHFLQNNHWIGGLLYLLLLTVLVFLLYLELRILQEQYIVLDTKGLVIETPLRDKKMTWDNVNKVIIKNGYLTIQFPDDRFSQYKLKSPLTEELYLLEQSKLEY